MHGYYPIRSKKKKKNLVFLIKILVFQTEYVRSESFPLLGRTDLQINVRCRTHRAEQ